MQLVNRVLLGTPASVLAAALFIPAATAAESIKHASRQGAWTLDMDLGAVHRFSADLDHGGKYDRTTFLARLSASRSWGSAFRGGLSVGYEHDAYGFDGLTSKPWGDVRTVSVGLPLSYRADEQWSLFALPRLRYSAETGASLGDGREVGILAGATYKVSDRVSVGPGFGISSQIESGSDVFPILLVNWQITDTLSLETGRGLAASRGPGLTLKWDPAGDWSLGLSGRYEKRRFRLNDKGPAPDGVGEERAVPVALTATYDPNRKLSVHVLAGAEFAGSLRLESNEGKRLSNQGYETAPFAALVVKSRF